MNRNLLGVIVFMSVCSGILFLSGCTSMNTITGKDVTTITIEIPDGLTEDTAEGDCEKVTINWTLREQMSDIPPDWAINKVIYPITGYHIQWAENILTDDGLYLDYYQILQHFEIPNNTTTQFTIKVSDFNTPLKDGTTYTYFVDYNDSRVESTITPWATESRTNAWGRYTHKESCTNISLHARANPVGKISQ